MSRRLPKITQRHGGGCPGGDCACPWYWRPRLPDGTNPRRQFPTLAEAEDDAAAWRSGREPLADRATTIAAYAERDWLPAVRATRRPGTYHGYLCAYRKHIGPHVGHYLMTEFRRADAKRWAIGLTARGTGPRARRTAAEVLHVLFGAWIADERYLPFGNPVPGGLFEHTSQRAEFTPWTVGEVAALASAIRPPSARLIIETQAHYGARINEVLGLREDDFTWAGRDPAAPLAGQLAALAVLPAEQYASRAVTLRFARQLDWRDRTPAPIKNRRGNRPLPLARRLAAAYAAQLGAWPPVGGWLFTNRAPNAHRGPDGEPLPILYRSFNEWFTAAADATGLVAPPGMKSHALRHHCVSVLRADGWSEQDIGYWIGDTAQAVTAFYGRPMAGAMAGISERLSAMADDPRHGLRAVE